MRPALSDLSYSFIHGTPVQDILVTLPHIQPTQIVILEDEPETTPGTRRWVPCPNCNGLDLTDAIEVCPTCDNRQTILTIQKVIA